MIIVCRYREDYVTSVVEALKGYKGNKEDPWGKAAFLMLDPFLNHRMNRRFAVNIPEIRNHITQNLEASKFPYSTVIFEIRQYSTYTVYAFKIRSGKQSGGMERGLPLAF